MYVKTAHKAFFLNFLLIIFVIISLPIVLLLVIGLSPKPVIAQTPTDDLIGDINCSIENKRYIRQEIPFQELKWQEHNTEENAATYSYNAPEIGSNEKVVGIDMIMDDKGGDWDYMISGKYNNGESLNTYDFNGPCDKFSPKMDSSKWEDICAGGRNASNGKENSHELLLDNASNSISTLELKLASKEESNNLEYLDLYWVVANTSCERVDNSEEKVSIMSESTDNENLAMQITTLNECTLTPNNYIRTNTRLNFRSREIRNFTPPAINAGQRVIGFNIIMNDNTGPWFYRPSIRLNNGQTIGVEGVTNPCATQTAEHIADGDFTQGGVDICTRYAHPITGRVDSHELKLLDTNNSINGVTLDFNFWGDNDDEEYLDIYDVEWIITDVNCSTTPTSTPPPTSNSCEIKDIRYNSTPVNRSVNAGVQTFNPPSITASQRVIGFNLVMHDNKDDWAYKPAIRLKDGTVLGKTGITDPCPNAESAIRELGPEWIDVCTGGIHPITGKENSHELKLVNVNNAIDRVDLEFRAFDDVDDPVRIFEIEWIIADCNPPVVTPTITPTDPGPQNLCTIKATNYIDAPNFSEIVTSTKGDKRNFVPPTVQPNQRVIGVNLIMNDFGDKWVYKPSVTLSNGQVVTKPGLSTPCSQYDNNVRSEGFDNSVWIDICTGQRNPQTGKTDVHELKLKDANTVINSVDIEISAASGEGGRTRIYGLEWIIADCEESGAIGECQVVPSVINPATSIKNGEKRISAVDKYKLSWTAPQIGNSECSYVNSEIYFTEKAANGACNYPSTPLATITDINQTELDINDLSQNQGLLKWNKDYCWKIKNNVQKLKVTEIVSNRETKFRAHSADNAALIPYWLRYDGVADNDSHWRNANTVFDNRWSICTVTSSPWRPSGIDPEVPSNCMNVNSFIFMNPNGDENIYPRIIQSTNSVNRNAYDREAFRRKFTLPTNAIVKKLTLYSSSDSVVSYYINTKSVNNQTGSLRNNNVCGQTTNAGSYRGIHKLNLDPSFVNPGNNILAGNLVNADECNTASPMGLQYILRAEYADLGDPSLQTTVESNNFTFATNKFPLFLRNGVSFDPNFKKDTGIEQNIPVGTVKCGFNTGCSIYPSETVPMCYSGNETSEKADNPVTFWFEYRDPDNDATINENYKHTFVFTKSNDQLDNFSAISNSPKGILHEAERDLIIEFEVNGAINKKGQQANFVEVIPESSGKYEDPSTKAIRVYYTLKFKEGFETNTYNVFGMFESIAPIANSAVALLADNMDQGMLDKSPQFWTDARRVTPRGIWGVDLVKPEVEVPEIIVSGVNEFGVNWRVRESGHIGDVTMGCYKTEGTSIPLSYIAPDAPFGISVNGTKEAPTQCVSNNDKNNFINLLNDGNAENNSYNSRYLIDDYKRFGDLGTVISASDRACNIADPKTQEAADVQENWISTRQGTTFVEKGIKTDRVLTQLGDPKQEKTYFTYDFSGNQKVLFEKATNDLTNLSTNFLGVNSGELKGNTSYIREEVTGYKDFNGIPNVEDIPAEIDTWFKYFEYIQKQKSRTIKPVNGISTNDVSKLPCGNNEACIYNNLRLSAGNGKNLCDTTKVVFVTGKLTIEDEILNKDDKSACLFVVDGSVEIKNTQPKKDREGIMLSPYDVIEAYVIASGKVTITQDQDLIGGKGYGDGIFVRGGIVAQEFENNRNLGIRNTIQPPALMVYDPRYLYLLQNEITARFIEVRETGFATPQP